MKTAVEYLVDEFKEKLTGDNLPDWVVKIIDQAKAMEKEQIIDAFFEGKNDGILMERYSDYKHITPNEYYNETYSK